MTDTLWYAKIEPSGLLGEGVRDSQVLFPVTEWLMEHYSVFVGG